MLDFNKQFFNKHQSKILFCANKWYLRWLLGLNRLPKDLKKKKIEKVCVASIHWKEGDKMKAACFTRPRFAEALAFNLSPLAYLKDYRMQKFQWRFSPVGVFGCLVLGAFGGGAVIGTTTNYYAGAGDGRVEKEIGSSQPSQANWDTVHNSSSGSANYLAGNCNTTSNIKGAANKTAISRSYYPCDTSGINDEATILSAILKIYLIVIYDDYNGDGYDYLAVVKTFQASTSELVGDDYEDCGYGDSGDAGGHASDANVVKGSSDVDINGLSTGSYQNFTLNATGLGWIVKDGITKIGLREGHDIEDNFPGDPGEVDKNSGIIGYTSEDNNDPYLEVTYTVAAADTGNMFALF